MQTTSINTIGEQFWNEYHIQTIHIHDNNKKGKIWFDLISNFNNYEDFTQVNERAIIDYYMLHRDSMSEYIQKIMFKWLTQDTAFSPTLLDNFVVLPHLLVILEPIAENLMRTKEKEVVTYLYGELCNASEFVHALFSTLCYDKCPSHFSEHPAFAFDDDLMINIYRAFEENQSIVNVLIQYYEENDMTAPSYLMVLSGSDNADTISNTLKRLFLSSIAYQEVPLHLS